MTIIISHMITSARSIRQKSKICTRLGVPGGEEAKIQLPASITTGSHSRTPPQQAPPLSPSLSISPPLPPSPLLTLTYTPTLLPGAATRCCCRVLPPRPTPLAQPTCGLAHTATRWWGTCGVHACVSLCTRTRRVSHLPCPTPLARPGPTLRLDGGVPMCVDGCVCVCTFVRV